MGYDCTLHVLDENVIRDRFIPRLLGESDEGAPFDPAYPLIEQGGRLVAIDNLLPSPEKFPAVGTITLGDGTDVFIWDSIGYEFKSSQFAPIFTLPGRWGADDQFALVCYGVDGFFCVCETVSGKIDERTYTYGEEGLFSVQRAQECMRHLPKVTRIRGIVPGPAGSVLVHEPTERGDLGKLYFPDDQTYVRIEPDVFADEDPLEIHSLHYIHECERLIAATSTRLWARPIDYILSLPRYNAATGRLVRSKSS